MAEQDVEIKSQESSPFGKTLGWGSRPALLIIDVCLGYWTEGCNLSLLANPAAVASPDSMRRLLAAAREGGTPVIWAQVRYNHPKMLDAGVQIKKSKTITAWQDGDTRGYDAWVPGLTPDLDDLVIYKRNPSAFYGTTLSTDLHLMNVDTLVLCGVSTSGCVRASAVDAICHGFRPMVVGSACGDRTEVVQKATLDDIAASYGDIVLEGDAIVKLKAGWS